MVIRSHADISEVLDFEVLPLGKAIALSKVEIER